MQGPRQPQFEHNKQRLIRAQPHLAKALDAIDWDQIEIVPARSGLETLKIRDKMVHSSFDPLREAQKMVPPDPQRLHVHIGLGLGYFIENDQRADDALCVVYEPEPLCLAAFLCRIDLGWFDPEQVAIFCDLDELEDWFYQNMPANIVTRLFVTPYHRQHFPEQANQAYELVEKYRQYRAVGRSTFESVGTTILASTLRSLPLTRQTPALDGLVGSCKGLPAVIVAAGPSLEKNLQYLMAYQDQVLIFAVSRVARSLEYYGIKPHFLVHIEAQDYRFLIEGCQNLAETVFLLPDHCDRQIFEMHPNPTFVYNTIANLATTWLSEQVPALKRILIDTGGSVATDATSCAHIMGCDPIVLIGQDLALTGGKIYTQSGTNLDFEFLKPNERMVPAYFGGQIRTVNNYQNFIFWYQDFAKKIHKKQPELNLINATEGGAHIRGFEQMPLLVAAQRFFTTDVRQTLALAVKRAQSQAKSPPDLLPCLTLFLTRVQSITSLSSTALEQVEEARKVMNQNRPEALRKRLQQLDQTCQTYEELNQNLTIFSGFVQASLFQAADLERETKTKSDVYREIADNLQTLQIQFEGSQKACVLLQPLLTDLIAELSA
ncbi:MAG: DUF115 domain-containing protein [Acidobacteria bacterium]|nr:DUF115 domain-containing protein [Acidobacteriota bacterium]MCB9397876.1 DUF115 domain-containing protein [Acidobacteriota bacterium]